jgi:ATP-binding cassette subfamily B protein RaxB
VLRDIYHKYGEGEPWVLRNLSLHVEQGEHVVIVGPSGCGKTTLLKIMLGLEQPASGQVLVDGEPLQHFGHQAYRNQIAVVMQNDLLFAGSIADNIAFFDSQPDMDRIWSCSKLAAIHDEIMLMPMRYESLVGDMGTTLSGGQKQRVLLARALYRQPRMLFMDEGTAHLDPATEAVVSEAISKLGITRVVIAHRSETAQHADRVIAMKSGVVVNAEHE